MTALTIGIDPGLSGAIAILDQAGDLVSVTDLPVISDLSLKWIDGGALQSLLLNALQGRQARAIVERVSAVPKQGVASSFQFGVGFGSRRSACVSGAAPTPRSTNSPHSMRLVRFSGRMR
jgi:crossover junction endodeoxyribonuclease RuvC